MLGIGAIITYPKNEYLRDIIKKLACHHIVLETDSPFLPPQSMRGKQNSPENVALIGQYYADLLGWPVEKIAEATTANAKKLFGI
jgi:TatD DNase family protein